MANDMRVLLNGEQVLVYDRNTRLPGHQRLFLDKMDQDMAVGIMLDGEKIEAPDENIRMHYVAMKLVQGILDENASLVSATSAYIANRYAPLKEIRAEHEGEELTVTFIF